MDLLNTGQGWRPRRGGRLPTAACLLASLVCAAGAVAGWADRSAALDPPRLLARRVEADGTTDLIITEPGALAFARQSAMPTSAGSDVIDVSSPSMILVKGSGGFQPVWHAPPWWPTAHTAVYGWTRLDANSTSVGPYRPGRSAFRVTFTRLTLPAPFLAATAGLLAAAPLSLTLIRRRRQAAPGFAVLPAPAGPAGPG